MTRETTLSVYSRIGWLGIGLGVAVLAVAPLVRRWMHLDTLKDEEPSPAEPSSVASVPG
jgi:POT family proton-dependent oligopeptide transporter